MKTGDDSNILQNSMEKKQGKIKTTSVIHKEKVMSSRTLRVTISRIESKW
jgi:hypothetical protein